MAEFTAGEVVVPVVPSAKTFIAELKKQILPGAYGLGQDIGRDIQRGISDSLKGIYEPLKEQTRKQQTQAPKDGADIGGAFAQGFKARLEAAFRSLPKAEIDADSTAAQVKISELRTRMQELASKTVGIDLDAGAALAEVAAIQRELSALDGKNVSADVRVDIASALAELAAVNTGLASVDGKTATANVHVDISGALGSIGVLSAALAGLAAIPVGAGLAAGVASLIGPLGAAGAGFAGVAAVAVPSIGRINEALKEQTKATGAAAGATTSAASAAATAASQGFQLEQAERRVVDAKVAAKAAEEGLTEARRAAKQAAEDLARAVANAALSEESASLSVEEARLRASQVAADPKSTELERKRADLAVREAEQRYKDAKARNKDLVADQKAADKAGIEGSKQVTGAKAKLDAANRAVKDSETQLKVLRLQQAAAAAQESKATGDVVTKMSKLSPAAKAAATQIKAFGDAYTAWQKKLEPAVLPAVTGALKVMQKLFKPLEPLIKGSAGALVGLEKAAAKALGGKFWTDFFKQLSAEAPKAITGLGKSFGNIITGIAGIVKAFLPFTGDVVGGIESATAKFAAFGKSLGESQGFKSFIEYAKTNGPKIIEVVKNIGTTLLNLFGGLSGTGSGALDVLVTITEKLASLSPETLQTIALAVLGVVAAFKTWKLITTAVDGVKKGIQTASAVVGGAKAVWSGLSSAATGSAKLVKGAASGIGSAVKGIASGAGKAGTVVWSGIQTAASKAASVAKTSGTAIANAAKTAGSAAAKGGAAAWSGIQVAATKAGAAAKTAGTAIGSAARTAGTAALSLGKVALEYGKVAAQAAIARVRTLAAAAAQGIIKVATAAWTVAQRLLNLALAANPIGLIVVAIGLLVAGLIYAWNNSETFRTVVTAAWEAIKAAVSAAWENVIKPALTALWSFIQNTLAPIFTWLWNSVIKPAWDGIAAAVTAAWTGVIQPALKALWSFIQTTLAPIFTWLWETIIKPAFTKVGEAIRTTWTTIIQPALKALWSFIKETLGPVFTWLYDNVIKPVFANFGTAIKAAWENVIQPALKALWTFITTDIPDGFKKGVGMIETFWNSLKDIAKKPINFVIETVYNNGIVKVWNAVADALGLKDAKLSTIPALAKGGIYPGYTPGRDVGLAAVSGGEAIMRPEWTKAVGEDYIHSANAAARSGGIGGVARFLGAAGDPGPGFAGAFATGGIVGGLQDLLASGLKFGAEQFLNPLLDQASAAMGDSPWAKMLVGVPKKLVADLIGVIGKKEDAAGGPQAAKAIAFARAQLGKPYQWGATGPNSYDCSGLTMRAIQAAGGNPPRVSQDQMKWVRPVPSPAPGDLGFPHEGHVWMYTSKSRIIEAPYTGANVREVAARGAQLIGRPVYDSGGYLPPGESLVYNGTGRPEPVLTDSQWQAVQGGSSRGGDGALLSIAEFNATPEQDPYAIAKDLRFIMGRRRR